MTPSTAKYHLKVFGQVKLARPDGTDVDSVLSRSKRLALLIYLAVSPRAFCRRDTVLGVFWPEFDQERARAALRKAVHFLRQELGDGIILARGYGEIGVDPEQLSCDVNDFEAALQKGDLESALGLYAGELLDGFYVSDAAEFEQWVEAKRRELKGKAARAVERLTNQAFAAHDPPTTARWAQEWTRLAPTDEAATRALVTAWDQAGERAKALEAYGKLATHLRDLELEPSPETQALAAGIRQNNVEALVDPVTDRKAPRPRPPPTSSRRSLMSVAAAIVVLTVAAFGVARLTTGSFTDDRPSVAVNAFTNLTDDPALASIGAVYQRAIADGLSQVSGVHVLALEDTKASATLTVGGSFHRVGDSLELTVEIVDHARGRTLPAPFPVRVPIADAAQQVDEVRRSMMGAVGYYTGLWHPVDPVRRPPNWEAYTTFQIALYTTMRRWADPGTMSLADSMFRRVIELDSLYTEAYFWLGAIFSSQFDPAARERAVYAQRGLYRAIDSLAQSMRTRIRPFTDLDRAVAEFQDNMVQGNFATALRWAQEMEKLLPSRPSLALLHVSVILNRPWAALNEVTTKIYSDWYFDYSLTWFYIIAAFHLAGDYAGEADAVDSARVRGGVWTLAELRARAAIGDIGRVRELAAPTNPWFAHRAGFEMRAHALERNDRELLAESERVLRWGMQWYDEAPEVWSRRLLAYWFLSRSGRIDEVVANLEAMVQDSAHLADVKGMLGAAYARQGSRDAASSIARDLATVDPTDLRGLHTLWRARIAAQLGNKGEAVRLLGQAFREGVWFTPLFPVDGSFWHTDPDFEPLWGYEAYERLIAPNQ